MKLTAPESVFSPLVSLHAYMGYVQVYDLAELGSAPLVPSFGLTCWTLRKWWRIGLGGMLSRLYDEHGEATPLNWS